MPTSRNKEALRMLRETTSLYLQGQMGAFMYYYHISQSVELPLTVSIPHILKDLANYPRQRDALRCYHELIQSKKCHRCGLCAFYPDEVRLGKQSWHQNCLLLHCEKILENH